ncbi:MAG TPA: response regulator [Rhodopila sp.]|nr:response regulator [Rhodopila sp.]
MTGTGCVLLAEDDLQVRETLADLLEIDGFRVVTAANAEEAMEIIVTEPTAVRILVTDLSMPGEDGIALIQRARRLRPGLPAILLTGLAEEPSCFAMQGGGFHVLRKPVLADDLTQYINMLTEHRDVCLPPSTQ